MTFKYNNVYINEVATVTGPYEDKGPLSKYYDKSYDDFYMGMKSWEQAESKLLEESVDILLSKIGKTRFDIDILFSGDRSPEAQVLFFPLTETSFPAFHHILLGLRRFDKLFRRAI